MLRVGAKLPLTGQCHSPYNPPLYFSGSTRLVRSFVQFRALHFVRAKLRTRAGVRSASRLRFDSADNLRRHFIAELMLRDAEALRVWLLQQRVANSRDDCRDHRALRVDGALRSRRKSIYRRLIRTPLFVSMPTKPITGSRASTKCGSSTVIARSRKENCAPSATTPCCGSGAISKMIRSSRRIA